MTVPVKRGIDGEESRRSDMPAASPPATGPASGNSLVPRAALQEALAERRPIEFARADQHAAGVLEERLDRLEELPIVAGVGRLDGQRCDGEAGQFGEGGDGAVAPGRVVVEVALEIGDFEDAGLEGSVLAQGVDAEYAVAIVRPALGQPQLGPPALQRIGIEVP